MQWDLGIFTAAVLTLLVLAVFQVSANRYISDGDFGDMTFSDPPDTCVKALVDQSPNNGSFGAQYKSQSSLSKICVNKLHLGKQGFLSNYRS